MIKSCLKLALMRPEYRLDLGSILLCEFVGRATRAELPFKNPHDANTNREITGDSGTRHSDTARVKESINIAWKRKFQTTHVSLMFLLSLSLMTFIFFRSISFGGFFGFLFILGEGTSDASVFSPAVIERSSSLSNT